MTTKERLISLLGFQPANINSIDGALIDVGLTGLETYTIAQSRQIKTVELSILQLLLSTADTSNIEGVSTKYDRRAVEARIKLLKGELGLTDLSQPTINTKRVW